MIFIYFELLSIRQKKAPEKNSEAAHNPYVMLFKAYSNIKKISAIAYNFGFTLLKQREAIS